MNLMRPRTLLTFPALAALLVALGCSEGVAPPTEPAEPAPRIVGPQTINKGDIVELSAELNEDAGQVSYEWFQTAGRRVILSNTDTAVASFSAPSVPTDQKLAFRLDVFDRQGRSASAATEIMVTRDPDYIAGGGSGPPAGDSGSSTGTDPAPRVRLTTSKGVIDLELDRLRAPVSVDNFLRYVDSGFYDNTLFHRVIKDFVIQGGGFEPGLKQKQTRGAIKNESDNGLRNDRGTIAMARTGDPNSATAQWYINLKNNDSLNARSGNTGYAVFGRVIAGLDIVDAIAAVTTETRSGFEDVPKEDVILRKAERLTTGDTGGGLTGDGSGDNGGGGDSDGRGDLGGGGGIVGGGGG